MTTAGQRLAPIPSPSPMDIAVGSTGNVYWTQLSVGAIPGGVVRRAPDGEITSSLQPGLYAWASAGTYRASAVATDAAGNASAASRVTFTVRAR